MNSPLKRLADFVEICTKNSTSLVEYGGTICALSRSGFHVQGLRHEDVSLGGRVLIDCNNVQISGEIIQLDGGQALVRPYDENIVPMLGASVFPQASLQLAPDHSWRGRVVDAQGNAIDGAGPLRSGNKLMPVETQALPALQRGRVGQPLRTGVHVIDIFTPLVFGQRMGIFAGSGVGKSTLLSMMAAACQFDTVVLALTGERGREVRDMLEETLRSVRDKVVSVVATGDESPMMRRLAPLTATTIAEYFASQGENVLLLVDSLTRFAYATREVAIAGGEPPVARGFPPSVFSALPRLLERAGPAREGSGSISGLYAVLVDGDDHNDPVADSVRGILDGHIVLDRTIAAQGRFPAVDIEASISRLANSSWTFEQRKLVQGLKEMISRYEETRDLRAMGAYQAGSDQVLDHAVQLVPQLYKAMEQHPSDPVVHDPYAMLAQALKLQS